MQLNRITQWIFFIGFLFPVLSSAQVNSVEFGKNRVQHKKFVWKFYQSPNFNTYVSQGGVDLGKFVAQVAENELKSIENFIEYSLQRRANIIVYNNYNDYKSSNIGLGSDWQNSGGLTKLVNNKLVVYFDGNHEHLQRQIREGIAKVLTDNLLFGDDIGEFASNQALLDLPKWLVDGYVSYAAQEWSTEKDDQLKSAILGGRYNSFYQFAFEQPVLAGHAFWYYIGEKYRKENITYLLYLARIYKNLNNACLRVCKKKFKEVLNDFMQYEQQVYSNDIRQRRNQPKGNLSVSEDVSKNDYFRFQANPNPKSSTYGVVEFKKGQYSVKLMENFYDARTLLKIGVRTNVGDINPNYPILAWDGKGTRLLVVYWEDGKQKMFVYDVLAKYKRYKQEINGEFDQILDATFMLDANSLIFSAVKNGHSDIYTYKIEENKATQITNDIYDDLDPTFVAFPNKAGIIFSSNRPNPNAPTGDTVLPGKSHFNIYMVDILNDSKIKQLTQLTNVKTGNARYPMQYNTNHFTYVSDENGIGNRWAGFFATQRNGLDTLYYVGDELLHNPSVKEFDSTLRAWQKNEPDSVSYFQVYKDSTYTFPITNYQSSLLETRIAGNNGTVSEVRREGDFKFLYKLKVDEQALTKRNVNARPTEYIRKVTQSNKAADGKAINYIKKGGVDTVKKAKDFFQNEFADEKPDSNQIIANRVDPAAARTSVLAKSRLFDYRLKFSSDYALVGFTNNILINRFQPYAGGSGPIQLNNGTDFNFTFKVGVSDLMEDVKFVGGVRFGTNLSDKDVFFSYQNLRKRWDWGVTYYRSNVSNFFNTSFNNMLYTNLYQANVSYPFNEVKSIRATVGLRTDKGVLRPYDNLSGFPDPGALKYKDTISKYIVSRIEYVHDNTINPTQNIWVGSRYKIYMDISIPTFKTLTNGNGKATWNFGFDGRIYHKIYRNFIWAGRAAGDFSWGGQKIVYYLGGVDGWISPQFNRNQPAADQSYAFQSLTVNMRGYNQNVANGNNAVVLNSEFRFPVFSTLINRPINNAFLRNFQLTQFLDLGTAWNGSYNGIRRPGEVVTSASTPVLVRLDAGGLGPFAGGYGFGIRSTLLGYFMKLDTGWPMKGVFVGKPVWYFALGFDF